MFSNQQKRGLLYLLLILIVIFLCIDLIRERRGEHKGDIVSEVEVITTKADSIVMFEFDPNTATLADLRALGLSKSASVSIIRWRSAGKVFRIKEDLYECYNLTDSIYYALEPYIKIGEEYQYKERASYDNTPKYQTKRQSQRTYTPLAPFLIDTVSVDYLYATGLLSKRQAEVFVKWHRMSGMSTIDDVRECYVVSDSIASVMEPYIIFSPEEPEEKKEEITFPVDINKADSATLRAVYGIGEKSVMPIIEYRQKLGGFYSVAQLSELEVVTESNFEKIIQQISCDSCDISKIDVNFAVAKKFIGHPYISAKALRRLLKTRQIKGGWSSIVEMTEDNIFTKEEATRLRPYLLFEDYTKLRE
ncbi:MAG: helix-hairpin-helix domain-containing protein [Rikenellaceae bacterium]